MLEMNKWENGTKKSVIINRNHRRQTRSRRARAHVYVRTIFGRTIPRDEIVHSDIHVYTYTGCLVQINKENNLKIIRASSRTLYLKSWQFRQQKFRFFSLLNQERVSTTFRMAHLVFFPFIKIGYPVHVDIFGTLRKSTIATRLAVCR